MDAWYAAMPIMKQIEHLGKRYDCPVRCNRMVSEHESPYARVDALTWTAQEEASGKTVHLNKFPAGDRVRLFRLAFSTPPPRWGGRTEYIVKGDVAQSSAQAAQQACRTLEERVARSSSSFTERRGR